jgi:hypothetical protein
LIQLLPASGSRGHGDPESGKAGMETPKQTGARYDELVASAESDD